MVKSIPCIKLRKEQHRKKNKKKMKKKMQLALLGKHMLCGMTATSEIATLKSKLNINAQVVWDVWLARLDAKLQLPSFPILWCFTEGVWKAREMQGV